MVNYMKSEFYRIFHDRTIYLLTAVITGLAVFVNVVLYLFEVNTTNFPYGNVRFSFINLITGMPIFYIGAMLVTGAAANLPFSLAVVILAVALNQNFKKESHVCIIWALIVYLIPNVLWILGLKLPLCARIAEWLPWNFLRTEVSAAYSSRQMDALWMHPEGFWKLMIVGVVGIVVFGAAGIASFRKKDIS